MAKRLLKALSVASVVAGVFGFSDYVKQNVRKNFGADRLIALELAKMDENIVSLLHEHGADDVGSSQGSLHVKISPEAVRALTEAGVEFSDHTEEFITNMEKTINAPDFFCYEGPEKCARKTMDDFYASYQSYDAIYTRLDDLRLLNTEMSFFDSIGYSYEGRSLKTLFIGDQTKPLVFYFCAIHSREIIVPMFCTYMAEMLIAGGEGHSLLDLFSFAILPFANPDGYVYVTDVDNSWRKTRKPNPGSSCIGTDGNRNYPVGWAGPGASSDTCSETYHGHSPLDQNETAAIAAFGASVKGRLFTYNDAHSYGEYWMCPWAGTYELPPAADYDKMETCFNAAYDAILASHGLEFHIGSVANTIYIASGGSVDYFYDELGVLYSYTLEARGAGLGGLQGFHPPPVNIMPSNEELFAGMEAQARCSYALEFGAPTQFPTGSPFECIDLSPNGIHYADGTPAPCDELEAYCGEYTFIPIRCPFTCDACQELEAAAAADKTTTGELESKFLNVNKGGKSHIVAFVLVAVGASMLGVVAALAVVMVRARSKKTAESEVAQVEL